MNATTRRQAELAERLQAFADAHPTDDAAFAPLQARLVTLIERLQTLGRTYADGRARVTDATPRMAEVRRLLVQDLLPHIARVADAAREAGEPLKGTYLTAAGNKPIHVLGRTAHDALAGVEAEEALLRKHGLAATAKPLLIAAVTRFDTLRAEQNGGRNAHVGARAEMLALLPELRTLLKLLDGFNRVRFGPGTQERAEWLRLTRLIGAPRREPEGMTGGDVAPAA